MPLSFPSVGHGAVAFGFFNIRCDMLLLQELFFFAGDFCAAMVALSDERDATLSGWRVPDARIGNLHGAIAGFDLSGFIGATYRTWPFPTQPEAFRQDPEGWRDRDRVRGLIQGFGRPESIPVAWDPDARRASLGSYDFDRPTLHALVRYVDRGGYPRWDADRRPQEVAAMTGRLRACGIGPFAGFQPRTGVRHPVNERS